MKQQRRKTREAQYFKDYKELLDFINNRAFLEMIQEEKKNATIEISFTCGLWFLTIIY